MLLENQFENDDVNVLSASLKTHTKINYNLKSLMRSEFIYEVDPDLLDQSLDDK